LEFAVHLNIPTCEDLNMIALLSTVYTVGTHCYLIWLHLDIAMDVEFMFYVHRPGAIWHYKDGCGTQK